MAQFTLPKNSPSPKARPGRSRPAASAHDRVPHLSLEPGRRAEPAHRHLSSRPRRLRADGPRRADLDQEQGRPDAHLPALLPRGHLRLLRHEHHGREHARLHARHRRLRGGHDQDLPAAAHAGAEGPGAGPDQLLRPARRDRALAADADRRRPRPSGGRRRRSAQQARRALRVHPVRLLHDLLPELLVERRPLPRPRRRCCRPTAG